FVPNIPVAFTTFAVGQDLYNQYQSAVQNSTPLPTTSLSIDAIFDPNRLDWNVIADSAGGDKNHTVVVDAHLDAIYGAGMLYKASLVGRDQAVSYLTSQGKNHEFFSPVGTDAFNFNLVGIPASGVLTGQDCCKTQQEVDLFGGFLGNFEGNIPSFDGGCVDNP